MIHPIVALAKALEALYHLDCYGNQRNGMVECNIIIIRFSSLRDHQHTIVSCVLMCVRAMSAAP